MAVVPGTYECIDVQTAGGVVWATLNRPERLNAYNGAMRYAMRDLLRDVRSDDHARVFVVTGAGRGFCSGADLGAEDRRGWPAAAHEAEFAWCLDLLEMPKPTIAAINGVAAGGGFGMALLCDVRICSSTARLIPVWMKRAIHPDDLITWTLPRLVGYSRALEWLYLADDIEVAQARECGLVNRVVEPEALVENTRALAERLAAGPTMHYALTKQAVLRGLTREASDAVLMEAWGQGKARASADYKEGVAAFREKRDPLFHGR